MADLTSVDRITDAVEVLKREAGFLTADIRRLQGDIDVRDIDPLDTAKRAASKLNRHQRRELMVHLTEIENDR